MSLTWVDGVAADTVPADDRGLNYADGAFETLSCQDGRIQHEDLHRSRLTRALAALGVPSAAKQSERLFEEAGQCLETAGHTGVARLTVTRGSGPRGYSPPVPPQLRSILRASARPNSSLSANTSTGHIANSRAPTVTRSKRSSTRCCTSWSGLRSFCCSHPGQSFSPC